MEHAIFVSGIGTGIGKTVVSAILAEALLADYWKPIQAGFGNGSDPEWVKNLISNDQTRIHPETYKLRLAASPHIAAREEGIIISLNRIYEQYSRLTTHNLRLIIEGAGGLLVPLNENEFVIDLIKKLNAKVILVSRNYLGSINHSLLTAQVCKLHNISVVGWVFNDQYLNYEDEIVKWSGYPKLASIPRLDKMNKEAIYKVATPVREQLLQLLFNEVLC